jgi:dihydrodipicolinate synthase/N-acetylneuraminate lyase
MKDSSRDDERRLAFIAAGGDGDDDEAERRQDQLTRLTIGLKQAGASTPAVTKAAQQLEGVIEERWCVPPLHSLPPSRLDHVRTALLP